jgi:hypothetical protein
MSPQTTRIRPETATAIRKYLNVNKFATYAREYNLEESRVFFNVVPLIVNAGIKIVPLIKNFVAPRSTEGAAFLGHFQHVLPAKTKRHEVNCGPIALLP